MPLPEFSGTLGIEKAAHLLRRATFGATKQQIDTFAGLTPAQAITALYRQALPATNVPIDPKTGTEWVLTGTTDANSDSGALETFFKSWFIGQMMAVDVSPTIGLAYSARERLVFFLHTHFTTITSKVGNSRSLYFQNQLFRLFALDALNPDPLINFKNLTVKVSIDNAMLRVLDGNENVKGNVNENFARELLELYTIGRGLEGTLPPLPGPGDYILYTEQDVKAAAHVMSGWDIDDTFSVIDIDTNLPRGTVKGSITNASSHDTEPKVFSPRFANTVIQGDPTLMNGGNATEASAMDEIVQLIDMIYAQTETAKHICWKLYRFFVYAPHIPAANLAIDGPIITEMANTLVANNYKIQPVIENLLRSQHFYDAAAGYPDDNFGGIIKCPLDLVVQTLKFFSVPITPMATSPTEYYDQLGNVLGSVTNQAMNFYEPTDVAGYESYYQFPIYHRWWITPNTLANRYNFIRGVISAAQPGMFKVDVYEYVKANVPGAVAADAKQLVIALVRYLLPVTDGLSFDPAMNSPLTLARLNYFEKAFLQTFDEAYWTSNWNANSPDNRDWLEYLFNAIMQSPEYQLA